MKAPIKADGAHEFALYITSSNIFIDQNAHKITIHDHDTFHRMTKVLRLKSGKAIILFNNVYVYFCQILEITQKAVTCTIMSSRPLVEQVPEIHLVVPLVERDALDDVVYMATVYGVASIQLVTTQKSRGSLNQKDYLRLEKIAIAAAEQSKQFCLPNIKPVVALEIFLKNNMSDYITSRRLWCDSAGQNIMQEIARHQEAHNYLVTVGPEGDYTRVEKELLKEQFVPVKLVNSILRSRDAVSLLLGIIRVSN